ncbi:receptor-like cytosolic serine/threonine-protein kinase RBK2 [Olea europaea var. sylvestris]|uniref:receptor-like cytosolic serine/threonine-protein kinase RBK2 n=1 Tax=Olea europaea var. sylvestris TaxID=158386 RepID=UPI000C1D2999|nr:receptor-like cytosolic serine/threonine-protein kinase RBK2 [Olea europaea var. sylvestris]
MGHRGSWLMEKGKIILSSSRVLVRTGAPLRFNGEDENSRLTSLNKLHFASQREKLAWCLRYKIALGVASGITYLHKGCQRRIIHRDVKSDNICLLKILNLRYDPNITLKITAFGLTKWIPDQWTQLTVMELEGTFTQA